MNGKIVFFAAFFYLISVRFLEYFFWCMPLSLLLLIGLLVSGASWKAGWWWGCIVYGTFFAEIMIFLSRIIPTNCWLLLWLTATFYYALQTALLFLIVAFLCKLHQDRCAALRYGEVVIVLMCYFVFVDRFSFWPCGVSGGLCLVNPLLPIMIPFFMTCADGALTPTIAQLQVHYTLCQDVCPHELASAFLKESYRIKKEMPKIKLIVTPESAFPFALNKEKKYMNWLKECSFTVAFLIGSFYENNKGSRWNVVYFFHEGACKVLAKNHAMPFIEMTPWWSAIIGLQIFCKNNSCSQETRAKEIIVDGVCYYVLICSEAFCTDGLSSLPRDAYALILVNDRWLPPSYRKIARIYMQLCAWWRQIRLIYIA